MAKKKELSTKTVKINPVFGSGLLSDSVIQTDSGKSNLQGIFTFFWAWGFPCFRTWFLTFTAFGIPEEKTSVLISIRKIGSRNKTSLLAIDTTAGIDNAPSTLSVQLSHSFDEPGRYEILCALHDASTQLRIPFEVRKKDWPEFSEEETYFARNNPQIPSHLRADVQCKQCSYAYIFEESILNDKPKGGVHRFPPDGHYECKECGRTMNLLDIQGRLRASLKEIIRVAIRRA